MTGVTAIIIPARYGSTRFPGKPLALIAGKTLLQRVVEVAQKAAQGLEAVEIMVATDDARIITHAAELGVRGVMTGECRTGSDRALEAARQLAVAPEWILNLQGDAPMTPPATLRSVMQALRDVPQADAVTPVMALGWDELDALRLAKQATPFSGTTVVRDAAGRALWFSKQVIPAIRGEAALREAGGVSPVLRHIGLYGYRRAALERFVALPESPYEKLEGLEQLRLLEAGMHIQTVLVQQGGRPSSSGVDAPEDVARTEALLATFGEPVTW